MKDTSGKPTEIDAARTGSSRRAFLGATAAVGGLTALGSGAFLESRRINRSSSGNSALKDRFDSAIREYRSPVDVDSGKLTNEAGQLCWDTGHAMLSLIRMYEAYKDPDYLRDFENLAALSLDARDEIRKVSDFGGRSGPVWRAGGPYVRFGVTLMTASGLPGLRLRCFEGSEKTLVRAHQTGVAGQVQLEIHHPDFDLKTPRINTRDGGAKLATFLTSKSPGQKISWTAEVLPAGLQEELDAGFSILQPEYMAFSVHTGVITYCFALYADLVGNDWRLFSKRGFADTLARAADQAISFHDPEWVSFEEGLGSYRFQRDSPAQFDGCFVPNNMNSAMGLAMLALNQTLPNPTRMDRVERLLRGLIRYQSDAPGYPSWSYWPPYSEPWNGYKASDGVSHNTPSYGPSRVQDDLTHAALSCEFLCLGHAHGLVESSVLVSLTDTYLKGFAAGDEHVRRVMGSQSLANSTVAARGAPLWCNVAPWNPEVGSHASRVWKRHMRDTNHGGDLLALAYLNWFDRSAWAR